MGMKLFEIEQTGERIEGGAWVDDLPNLPDVAVKVRGPFNSEYNALFAKLAEGRTPEELRSDEVREEIDTRLLVDTILVEWKGIDDLPYSKEAAQEILSNPKYKIFRRAVNYAANNVARIGKASLEEAVKN